MANAAKIQADYDQLGQIAAQFAQHGDQTLALSKQVYNCLSQLQNGGWIGVGANRFYNEMDSLVMPAVERLMNALNTSSMQTERIAQILRTAEEEAARLFQGSEQEYSTGPVLGGTSGEQEYSTGPVLGGTGSFTGVEGGWGYSGSASRHDPTDGAIKGGLIGAAIGGMLLGPGGALMGAMIGSMVGFTGPFKATAQFSAGPLSGTLTGGLLQTGKSRGVNTSFFSLDGFKKNTGKDKAEGGSGDSKDSKGIEFKLKEIWKKGGELWSHWGAVWSSDLNLQVGGFKGSGFLEFLSYDTSGKWDVKIGHEGVKAGLSGDAGLYLARTGVTAEVGGLQAAGVAYLGANAQGNLTAALEADKAIISAGGRAFVGAMAGGNVSYTQELPGGLKVTLGAEGYVGAGAGAEGKVKIGYEDGKFHFGVSKGLVFGVGGGGGVSVSVDIKDTIVGQLVDQGIRTVGEGAQYVVDFARTAVDIGRMFLP